MFFHFQWRKIYLRKIVRLYIILSKLKIIGKNSHWLKQTLKHHLILRFSYFKPETGYSTQFLFKNFIRGILIAQYVQLNFLLFALYDMFILLKF